MLLDFVLLGRDEIWFVEKQEDGSSRLYSMEEYNEWFDRLIEKACCAGRYGAIPRREERLLDLQDSE